MPHLYLVDCAKPHEAAKTASGWEVIDDLSGEGISLESVIPDEESMSDEVRYFVRDPPESIISDQDQMCDDVRYFVRDPHMEICWVDGSLKKVLKEVIKHPSWEWIMTNGGEAARRLRGMLMQPGVFVHSMTVNAIADSKDHANFLSEQDRRRTA